MQCVASQHIALYAESGLSAAQPNPTPGGHMSEKTLESRRRASRLALAVVFAAVAAGCGGGSGSGGADTTGTNPPAPAPSPSPPPPPAPAPGVVGAAEGIWEDNTLSTTRYALVEADGQLWGLPGVSPFNVPAGVEVIKGSVAATSAGNVTGTFRDILARSCELVYTCTVSGLASSSQLTLNGGESLGSSTIPGWTFSGTKEANYSTQAAVSQIVGTWNMSAMFPANFTAAGALTVGSTGAVSVTNIGGCSFAGTLTPAAGRNYFHLALSSVGGTRATGMTASQATGVAFATSLTGLPPVLHVLWHNTSLSQALWAGGTK